MKNKYINNSPLHNKKSLRNIEESEETIFDDLVTSTPLKANERRAISLSDISQIASSPKDKITASTETLSSNSSICKDSGYNRSESSRASDKLKGNVSGIDIRLKYDHLLEDLKYKDVLISSLHESNLHLRLKLAEAENKITDLRLKSQSHCKCCTYQAPKDSQIDRTSDRFSPWKYGISSFAKSEPCLFVTSPMKTETCFSNRSLLHHGESSPQIKEDTFSKVKQWQKSIDNLKESHKRLVSHTSPTNSVQKSGGDPQNIITSSLAEPLANTMSYMETSRALAETYRRRQDKSSDLFSFQVFDNQSSGVQNMTSSDKNTPLKNIESPKEETDLLPQSILKSILLRNQTETTTRLLECLRDARRYSSTITAGLSQLPEALDEIRYFLGIQVFESSDTLLYFALAFLFFAVSFFSFTYSLYNY